MINIDSFKCRKKLQINGQDYIYFSLPEAEKNGLEGISKLPFSMKILLENLLRNEDNRTVTKEHIQNIAQWLVDKGSKGAEIAYRPSRVLMQDFTGVPAVVDLAAMRDAMLALGSSPQKINPLVPVDLVIDHSVIVDDFGNPQAFKHNVQLEYKRNMERYRFLKWGQEAFQNFRVVPPGTGICHQVNLEYLAQCVFLKAENGEKILYPDTCVGTDSHTTMINGLGVLGWGVGGIEAEAAMLGQPVSMLIPEVIGFKLTGELKEGVTATDLVLTVTEMLRQKGVVGKFVEFFGEGLNNITLADRATLSNMGPEYGATCGFFPTDAETIRYLHMTGRSEERICIVEEYCKAQGMWRNENMASPEFTDTLELDMTKVVPSMAGPKRPEGRLNLQDVSERFVLALSEEYKKDAKDTTRYAVENENFSIGHGDVVIAAITSCTNTSNPSVLIAAGLLARNAAKKGLKSKPWVKTSLAPGSKVVEAYLTNSGLQEYLDELGFNLVGFGCTTCIGNSGPLLPAISKTINENGLIASSVLSGNRNFEGRVSPDVNANYLASPPLVVAYAIAGTIKADLTKEPLGYDKTGAAVYLRDIWPTAKEVQEFIEQNVTRSIFLEKYSDVFKGDEYWQQVQVPTGETYSWDDKSTYVRNPPYFENMQAKPSAIHDIVDARILGLFGDKITTDHISPAGAIKTNSPAGKYLLENGVEVVDFNQYGTRRGNHEVMMRGTFANIRIKNLMLNGEEGGNTLYEPGGEKMSIFDAAMKYRTNNIATVVLAGLEYGNGSSRDWAAKGPNLLGVKAVIARSFERIHRSNLVGMGIAPFVFTNQDGIEALELLGSETITIKNIKELKPRDKTKATITYADGTIRAIEILFRVDTYDELEYFHNGGILQYVLRNLAVS